MKESNSVELKLALPDLLSQEEFFEGYSLPRNKEIMRIFKDLDMVEYLGSGMPRILRFYDRKCFKITDNFLRMIFPNAWNLSEVELTEQTTQQVEAQVEAQVEVQVEVQVISLLMDKSLSSGEIAKNLGHKQLSGNLRKVIPQLRERGIIEFTLPDKPNSRLQKYRLTEKGKALQKQLKNDGRH